MRAACRPRHAECRSWHASVISLQCCRDLFANLKPTEKSPAFFGWRSGGSIDLYSGGHPRERSRQAGHRRQWDRNALREPNPGEDWIDRSNALAFQLCNGPNHRRCVDQVDCQDKQRRMPNVAHKGRNAKQPCHHQHCRACCARPSAARCRRTPLGSSGQSGSLQKANKQCQRASPPGLGTIRRTSLNAP